MIVHIITSFVLLFNILTLNTAQTIAKQKCSEFKKRNVEGIAAVAAVAPIGKMIIGGTQTQKQEFPHMAALGYGDPNKYEWQCGGTLVSENYILTAAHCARHRELGDVKIARLGTTNVATPFIGGRVQDKEIKKIVASPRYKAPARYHDIALLQMSTKAEFNNFVFPACLNVEPNVNTLLKNSEGPLTAAGWGVLQYTGKQSDDLMKVNLNFVPTRKCKEDYSSNSLSLPKGIHDGTQICAGGGEKMNKDTCQGDSGGPLHIKKQDKFIVVGITSFGKPCGFTTAPGVYTKVSAYLPWIESIVWPQKQNLTQKPKRNTMKKPKPSPTQKPKRSPTQKPKRSPTQKPKQGPTQKPKRSPTQKPKRSPTQKPKRNPTQQPKRDTKKNQNGNVRRNRGANNDQKANEDRRRNGDQKPKNNQKRNNNQERNRSQKPQKRN